MATVAVKDVNSYLSSKQREGPTEEVASVWAKLEDLYNRRLWHQLTLLLEQFIRHDIFQKDDALLQLYNNFIQTFENKINPLALVEILVFVVDKIEDKKEAIQFLEKTEVKVKGNVEASALCKVVCGRLYLHCLKDIEGTKKVLDDLEKLLDEANGITAIHGRYYMLASQFYRIQGKHADYYRTALRYLGCIDIVELSEEEQAEQAFFLGLAALLGDGVYNLGELLAHPVLDVLKDSNKAWLVELLYAFNTGDIALFEKMRPQWSTIPDLNAQQVKLRQKISLLCLMEMTFKRPATDRQLTFEEIAKETRLPLNEVEHLVMKALAQGLVRGAIDQVSEKVHMTWVQPRVLNKQQISSMVQRLDVWCKDVNSMETLLETRAHEFLTL